MTTNEQKRNEIIEQMIEDVNYAKKSHLFQNQKNNNFSIFFDNIENVVYYFISINFK